MKSHKSIFEMTAEELAATTKATGTWKSRKRTRFSRSFVKKQRSVNQKVSMKDKADYYRDRIAEGRNLDQVWDALVNYEPRLLFFNEDLEEWVVKYREI